MVVGDAGPCGRPVEASGCSRSSVCERVEDDRDPPQQFAGVEG
jgi:hypothetical protein